MRILIYALLWFTLALPANAVSSATSDHGKSTSTPPDPLAVAAEKFKTLTHDWGMRPDSPPTAQQQHSRKWLWHGRLYENFRNDVLDAIPHEVKQNGENKSLLRRNQFGFNVAGPVLIPHLIDNPHNAFFMFSFEGVRESIFRASLHTIPTLLERQGDFSQTVDQAGNPLMVYDPDTTSAN